MCPSELDDSLLDELTTHPQLNWRAICSVGRWLDDLDPKIAETVREAVRRGASWQILEDRLRERGLNPPAPGTLSRHFKGRCKCPSPTT